MNVRHLERHFARMGARAQFRALPGESGNSLRIDVGRDREGEYFDLAIRAADTRVTVIDVQPKLRHLLVLSQAEEGKSKFLCGHDERHWFVAAVPEQGAVSNVRTAFEALKPAVVRLEENRRRVKSRKRQRRRNEAFVRQGEWFFIPTDDPMIGTQDFIFRNEPISRGGQSKPHFCEELIRQGGELVYVAKGYPNALTEPQYHALISRRPRLVRLNWTSRRRNATVLVRGRIRHPDHKTIYLRGWHQVLMNTENLAPAMKHVAFID